MLPSITLNNSQPEITECSSTLSGLIQTSESYARCAQFFFRQERITSFSYADEAYLCRWQHRKSLLHEVIELQAADWRIYLNCTPASFVCTDRPWWNYEGEVRLLAWALEHEKVIALFQKILDLPLTPTKFVNQKELENEQNMHCLAWEIFQAQGSHFGEIAVSNEILMRLNEKNEWLTNKNNGGWSNLIPLKAILKMPTQGMILDELRLFQPGDILLANATHVAFKELVLQLENSEKHWKSSWEGRHLTIVETLCSFPEDKDITVNNPSFTTPELNIQNLENTKISSLSEIPIQLSFQLAQLQLSVGEIERIQPGYVFSFATRIENLRPLLLANDTPIGRGELVAIGDQLGLRLLELNINGL